LLKIYFIYYKPTIGFNSELKIYFRPWPSRWNEENNRVRLEEESWVTVTKFCCLDNSSGTKRRMKMRFRKCTSLVCLPVSVTVSTSIKLAAPSQQNQIGYVKIFSTYFVLNCTINFVLYTISKKIVALHYKIVFDNTN